ncbi:hypothetical protein D3C86_1716740 [compost metagenome]
MAFQQADHGQRQQDDQGQVAGLDETRADGGQDSLRSEARGKSRGDGGDDHHQHRIETQDEARDDDADPDQGPKADVCNHWKTFRCISGARPADQAAGPRPFACTACLAHGTENGAWAGMKTSPCIILLNN